MNQNKITIHVPDEVENNLSNFAFFTEAINTVSNLKNSKIYFDFSNTSWFEANLTAVFGVIINVGSKNNNKLALYKVNKKIKTIFRKNNFYTTYGLGEDIDTYNSTIKYTIFNSENKPEFSKYIKNELIPKIKVSMSDEFKKIFRIALEELFQNARTHGKCESIYTCGQYFHSNKKVKFTVIDLGRTILDNVRTFLNNEYISADQAIDWATIEGHSTRASGETGGIGISFIRDFLSKNQGRIQIISSDGYWEEYGCVKYQSNMEHMFPGTIVNIEVNVNDWNTYITKNEAYKSDQMIENIF